MKENKMKNILGKIIEVHLKNKISFYIGEVINDTENYIILNTIDIYGKYDGKMFFDKKLIDKYVKNSKYLNFIKNDFVQYALKNNKMLSISCSKWLNIRNMKLIKFENNELTCQFINQIGEKKKIYKLTLDKIDLIDFDSLELKTYEKLL